MPNKPDILLIYTGGTIGMIKDPVSGALKAFDFDNLINKIPEINLLDCNINTYSFTNPIDSSDFDVLHWQTLCQIIESRYELFDGFVILHGSDTMSYSASALSFAFDNLDKPIIFTGSQLPIGDLRTDAKENLITSIELTLLKKDNTSLIKEVCLYFEYKLYRGNRSTKVSAANFNAFESPNFPILVESGVQLIYNEQVFLRPNSNKLNINSNFNKDLFVLHLHPGINKEVIKIITKIPHLKALILVSYGSGNVTNIPWFLEAIDQITNLGIIIVNASQCRRGRIDMSKYENGRHLLNKGVWSAHDMTLEATIVKIMHLLAKEQTPKNQLKTLFETDLKGELSNHF